jgi:hypothetical protein
MNKEPRTRKRLRIMKNIIIEAITGFPISMEEKTSASAHPSNFS